MAESDEVTKLRLMAEIAKAELAKAELERDEKERDLKEKDEKEKEESQKLYTELVPRLNGLASGNNASVSIPPQFSDAQLSVVLPSPLPPLPTLRAACDMTYEVLVKDTLLLSLFLKKTRKRHASPSSSSSSSSDPPPHPRDSTFRKEKGIIPFPQQVLATRFNSVLQACIAESVSVLKSRAATTAFTFMHYLDTEEKASKDSTNANCIHRTTRNSVHLSIEGWIAFNTDGNNEIVQSNLGAVDRYPMIVLADIGPHSVGASGYDGASVASMLTIRLSDSVIEMLRDDEAMASRVITNTIVHEFVHYYRREFLNHSWSTEDNTPHTYTLLDDDAVPIDSGRCIEFLLFRGILEVKQSYKMHTTVLKTVLYRSDRSYRMSSITGLLWPEWVVMDDETGVRRRIEIFLKSDNVRRKCSIDDYKPVGDDDYDYEREASDGGHITSPVLHHHSVIGERR